MEWMTPTEAAEALGVTLDELWIKRPGDGVLAYDRTRPAGRWFLCADCVRNPAGNSVS